MPICSIKYYEKAPEYHVYKGRCCFRGDAVRDQDGAPALFQELSANPATVHAANANLAYGRIKGHKTTMADAVRAYIQSKLNTSCPTWVHVPKEFQPEHWKGRYQKPMCQLIQSLYGHPEAGAHWERHLNKAVRSLGGKPVPNHPSSFFFDDTALLLTIYVDDLLLSGPADKHSQFWDKLGQLIRIETPEPLGRFLGREHDEVDSSTLEFNMEDFCVDVVELYKHLTGLTTLKKAQTPFHPDGALPATDDCEKGVLDKIACKVLMKALWLARLARPDLQKAICDLASRVSCWSRNDDKRLYRLVCYIHSTSGYRLRGSVNDPATQLELKLYVDADFCGDSNNTRSTSGGLLVLHGPTTYFPLTWISKRQTATSRSTTEAEMVALANGLFLEALPALDMWEMILRRKVRLTICEDNEATIKVAKKGYSAKLRHVLRHHKVDVGSVKEVLDRGDAELTYIDTTSQAADIFTKGLAPLKWPNALGLLNIRVDTPQSRL